MYQDLSTHHDWPVKKAIVNLLIRLKGNLKCISGKLLSPLRAENKDFAIALQTLLTGVRLPLQCRLANTDTFFKTINLNQCWTGRVHVNGGLSNTHKWTPLALVVVKRVSIGTNGQWY